MEQSIVLQEREVATLEVDPLVLLCLLAVRQLGGKSVPAKQDLFAKGLKGPLQTALEKGWLEAKKAALQLPGKAKPSKVDVLDLTDEGDRVVRQAAQPEVLQASATGQLAGLRRQLEEDRQQLKDEILALFSSPKGGKPKTGAVAKEASGLAKAVAELGKRLEKVEAALQAGGNQEVLQKIDEAFAGLLDRLGQRVPHGQAAPVSPASPAAGTAPTPALRVVLRRAYDSLCQLIDFEDRLVPLDRLFHQARHEFPGLTVDAFHRELQALWDERELELQVANDPRAVKEPDKVIRRGDNLYYYALWHRK
jgi:hypothetical protein